VGPNWLAGDKVAVQIRPPHTVGRPHTQAHAQANNWRLFCLGRSSCFHPATCWPARFGRPLCSSAAWRVASGPVCAQGVSNCARESVSRRPICDTWKGAPETTTSAQGRQTTSQVGCLPPQFASAGPIAPGIWRLAPQGTRGASLRELRPAGRPARAGRSRARYQHDLAARSGRPRPARPSPVEISPFFGFGGAAASRAQSAQPEVRCQRANARARFGSARNSRVGGTRHVPEGCAVHAACSPAGARPPFPASASGRGSRGGLAGGSESAGAAPGRLGVAFIILPAGRRVARGPPTPVSSQFQPEGLAARPRASQRAPATSFISSRAPLRMAASEPGRSNSAPLLAGPYHRAGAKLRKLAPPPSLARCSLIIVAAPKR